MTTTSHQTALLAEPTGDARISERTLAYVSETAREEVFDLVAGACVESGVSRGNLAKRLAKDPAQVTRLLSAPGNWTVDTISHLLFAINGSMLRVDAFKPLEEATANMRFSRCLDSLPTEIRVIHFDDTRRQQRPTYGKSMKALSWR